MKNNKNIIITSTTIIVLGILYLAFKKVKERDISNNPSLEKDYQDLIKKIDEAKK